MGYRLESRARIEVNTDPQRRCYYGVHARSELRWTEWGLLDCGLSLTRATARLTFWRELNDYALSQRGEKARRQYRMVEEVTE